MAIWQFCKIISAQFRIVQQLLHKLADKLSNKYSKGGKVSSDFSFSEFSQFLVFQFEWITDINKQNPLSATGY